MHRHAPTSLRRVVFLLAILGCASVIALTALPCSAQDRSENQRLDRYGDPLPAGALFRLGTTRLRHGSSLNGVAWSPDGRLIASCGWDGVIRLWNADTAKLVRALQGEHRNGSFGIAFSPDGERLVATGESGVVRVFEVASGRELFFQQRHVERTFGAAWSPDGLFFASAGSDRTLRLWNAETYEPALSLLQPQRDGGNSHAVAFSKDGTKVAAGFKGNILIWSLTDGGPPVTIEKCHRREIYSLIFLPNGDLVSGGEGRNLLIMHDDNRQVRQSASFLRVWNTETGGLKREFPIGDKWGNQTACSVSADGRVLVAVFRTCLAVYDAGSGRQQRVIEDYLNLFGTRTHGISVSPDGSRVAAIGGDHVVRIWDTGTGEPLHRFEDSHDERVEQVAVSPDSSLYATASYDGTFSLWKAEDGSHVWRRKLGDKDDAGGRAIAFSPDGSMVAGGGWTTDLFKPGFKGHLNVWDARTGDVLVSKEFEDRVMSLTFARDSKKIAVGIGLTNFGFEGGQKQVQAAIVVDAKDGKELARTEAPRARLIRMRFAPDGQSLLMADEQMALHHWRIGEKKDPEAVVLTGHERRSLRYVAFTRDASTMATSDLFGDQVILRKTTDGSAIRTMKIPNSKGSVLNFSKDGLILATASIALTSTGTRKYDSALRLWSVSTGQKLFERVIADLNPNCLALTPDGTRLLAGGDDGSTLVLDVSAVLNRATEGGRQE